MPKEAAKTAETFVLSVGGSLIVTPSGIDLKFLKSFRKFIIAQVKTGKKFILVAGGGVTARKYMKAALETAPVTALDRDWVGIRATRLNAELLRVIFGRYAHPEIITDPSVKIKMSRPLAFAAGYRPGHSTDHGAVLIAKSQGAKTVINLSNIDFAYDKDPRLFADAKKVAAVGWKEFRKIVGSRWQPGLNVPFDPVASREADEFGIRVVILNGQKLKNLEACLEGGKFKGTVIE